MTTVKMFGAAVAATALLLAVGGPSVAKPHPLGRATIGSPDRTYPVTLLL